LDIKFFGGRQGAWKCDGVRKQGIMVDFGGVTGELRGVRQAKTQLAEAAIEQIAMASAAKCLYCPGIDKGKLRVVG
jgi:hypothetical protein